MKSQLKQELPHLGSSLSELEKFLSSKLHEMTKWTHLLKTVSEVPAICADPILEKGFRSLYDLRRRISMDVLGSITSQSLVLLTMIERARVLCLSASSTEIPYTDLISETIEKDCASSVAVVETVNLRDLITLLGNEIVKWICETILQLCDVEELFAGLSLSDFHCGFMIGNDSLYRLAVTATHSSNIRYWYDASVSLFPHTHSPFPALFNS